MPRPIEEVLAELDMQHKHRVTRKTVRTLEDLKKQAFDFGLSLSDMAISSNEFARFVGITPTHVCYLCKRQAIDAEFRGFWRIPFSEVQKFLTAKKSPATDIAGDSKSTTGGSR